jgi:hypothetical protein
VIDTRAVFQQGFRELDYAAMPALLRPHVGRHGLCDYEKVFCADLKRGEDIFDLRGIDRAAGCMVVVRPDQYVGMSCRCRPATAGRVLRRHPCACAAGARTAPRPPCRP